MEIVQHPDGRTSIRINGREIVEHYPSGDHYTTHYTDSGLMIKAADTQYMYDGEGRLNRSFDTVNGHAELYAYDPYGNRIGYYSSSHWSNSRYVVPHTYSRLKDGSVKGSAQLRVSVNSYEEWRDKLPTNFEPEPYKEPEKKVTAKRMYPPYGGWSPVVEEHLLDSHYMAEVYERLQREQAEARLDTDRRSVPRYVATRDPSYDGQIRYVRRDANPFDML